MKYVKAVGIGVAAGIASGLIGIGGALIMVPGMVYLLNVPQHEAQATSLVAIIPGAVVSAYVYYSYGQLDFTTVGLFAVGGMAGAYIGSTIMPKVKPSTLRMIFAVFTLAMSVKMGVF